MDSWPLVGRSRELSQITATVVAQRGGDHRPGRSVSRTPVREALVRLEPDGLIDRRGATARLRERSAEEINDIYRARTWLEQAIAEDAAIRRGEIDLLRLQDAVDAEGRLDPAAGRGSHRPQG